MYVFTLFVIFVSIFQTFETGKCRDIEPLDEETYAILVKLVSGTFNVPVRERSSIYRNSYIRFHRHGQDLSVKAGILYFQNRRVVLKSEIQGIIQRYHEKYLGTGARKLYYRIHANHCGISERMLQHYISNNIISRRLNVRFEKPKEMKTVSASKVNERHQIDLMDMGAQDTATYKGTEYRYILTVIDVFSRFVWLTPLSSKCSADVASFLKQLYRMITPPTILQSDNGGEFRGLVDVLCNKLGVNHIRSRPYHPQSQGKVERIHRSIRRKIAFIQLLHKHANWVKSLDKVRNTLNSEHRKMLGNQTPNDVYFGATADAVDKAYVASEKANAYRSKETNIKSTFNVGDKVFIRMPKRRHRRQICEGVVMKQHKVSQTYNVSYTSGNAQKKIRVPWYDIVRQPKLNTKRAHKAKYYIVLEKRVPVHQFLRNATEVEIVEDPRPDGNCLFSAVCHHLKQLGIFRSHETIREDVVDYMLNNKQQFENFVENWDEYIRELRKDGTYGDQLTLVAMATLYGVDFEIISSAGAEHDCFVRSSVNNAPTLYLGHYTEDAGAHYVSLSVRELSAGNTDGTDSMLTGEDPSGYGSDASVNSVSLHDEAVATRVDDEVGQECVILLLPEELLTKILKLCTQLPTRQYASLACKRFQNILSTFNGHFVYLNPALEKALMIQDNEKISINRLNRVAGRQSGLMLRMKDIVYARYWPRGWVVLTCRTGDGWYTVNRFFFRKKSRHLE